MGATPLLKYLFLGLQRRRNHGDENIPILLFKLLKAFVKLCQQLITIKPRERIPAHYWEVLEGPGSILGHLQPRQEL